MRGVYFIASGEKYFNEAVQSSRSIRRTNPDLSIAIATDIRSSCEAFDIVKKIKSTGNGYMDKIRWMSESPFDRTVFLDTDTLVVGDLKPLYEALDRFDLVLCHAPFREIYSLPGIPISFPEMNTGMMAFNSTPEITGLFSEWYRLQQSSILSDDPRDQPYLRKVLYESSVRFLVTIEEFNCRFRMGYAQTRVVVLHDRHPQISQVERAINRSCQTKRIFRITPKGLDVLYPIGKETYWLGIIRAFKQLFKALINRI